MPDPWTLGLDLGGKLTETFKGDQTVNYGAKEQAALDSDQGQKIYKGYRDYGLTVQEAAALTVADLVTGDQFADQKAARKKMFASPLYQAQVKYPNDPSKWPAPVTWMDSVPVPKPEGKGIWDEAKSKAEDFAKSKAQGFLDSLLGPLTDRGGKAAGEGAATRLLPWIIGGVAVLALGIVLLTRRR